jgi:acetyl esterase
MTAASSAKTVDSYDPGGHVRRLIVTGIAAGLVAGLAGMAVPAAWAEPGQGEPDVTVDANVTYRSIDGEQLTADVYVPAGDGDDRPAVLVVHGGGWQKGDRGNFAREGTQLAEAGFVAVSVNYRLAPEHTYPAAVEDVQAAVEWLRKRHQREAYGIDPDRIGALGGSAGGHLVGMLGALGDGSVTKRARVAAVVSWSGPMDLTSVADLVDAGSAPDDRAIPTFLGCTPGDCPAERAEEASPFTHVDDSDPPMLLVNSDAELVPLALVQPLVDALDEAEVEHELLLLPGDRHSRQYSADVIDDTIAFFDDHLVKIDRKDRKERKEKA